VQLSRLLYRYAALLSHALLPLLPELLHATHVSSAHHGHHVALAFQLVQRLKAVKVINIKLQRDAGCPTVCMLTGTSSNSSTMYLSLSLIKHSVNQGQSSPSSCMPLSIASSLSSNALMFASEKLWSSSLLCGLAVVSEDTSCSAFPVDCATLEVPFFPAS
jgi:hypothetical protein